MHSVEPIQGLGIFNFVPGFHEYPSDGLAARRGAIFTAVFGYRYIIPTLRTFRAERKSDQK